MRKLRHWERVYSKPHSQQVQVGAGVTEWARVISEVEWLTPSSPSPSCVAYGWRWHSKELRCHGRACGASPAPQHAPHPGSALKLTCCACRYARRGRDQGSFWLMIVHLLHSTSLICSCFRRYLTAVTDILLRSVAFTAWECSVSFCFNLTGNSGLVGPSTDWKHLFEGLDFFKKPQMNIHLWIQLLLWFLFFKLLAS